MSSTSDEEVPYLSSDSETAAASPALANSRRAKRKRSCSQSDLGLDSLVIDSPLVDNAIKRPSMLGSLPNVENEEGRCALAKFEKIYNDQTSQMEVDGNVMDVSYDDLMGMLAYAGQCSFEPPNTDGGNGALGSDNISKQFSIDRVNLVLEMIEYCSMESDDDRAHLAMAIMLVAIDQKCDQPTLRSAIKALDHLFESLCVERRNAVFIAIADQLKYDAASLNIVQLCLQVMTACEAMTLCKLLCVQRVFAKASGRTVPETKPFDNVTAFDILTRLLCSFVKNGSMQRMLEDYNRMFVLADLLGEAVQYDVVMDAKEEDVEQIKALIEQWTGAQMKRNKELEEVDWVVVKQKLRPLMYRMTSWRSTFRMF